MRFYPPEAARHQVPGWAEIRCRVLPTGALSECVALDEAPRGWCFGAYAVELTFDMRSKSPPKANDPPRYLTKDIRFSLDAASR